MIQRDNKSNSDFGFWIQETIIAWIMEDMAASCLIKLIGLENKLVIFLQMMLVREKDYFLFIFLFLNI